jgi:hypothetical protein|tara:strand:+ start:90 stop:317 length:228 start_codon:yes stop_codon:yes gene_type:complete
VTHPDSSLEALLAVLLVGTWGLSHQRPATAIGVDAVAQVERVEAVWPVEFDECGFRAFVGEQSASLMMGDQESGM